MIIRNYKFVIRNYRRVRVYIELGFESPVERSQRATDYINYALRRGDVVRYECNLSENWIKKHKKIIPQLLSVG